MLSPTPRVVVFLLPLVPVPRHISPCLSTLEVLIARATDSSHLTRWLSYTFLGP